MQFFLEGAIRLQRNRGLKKSHKVVLKVIVPYLSNNGVNVSRRTVNNVLNKCSQTRANTRLRKTFQKSSLRLEFVHVYLENVSDFWNSVLWGHETEIEFV